MNDRWVWGTVLVVLVSSPALAGPLVYSGTLPDVLGVERDVAFKGELAGQTIAGTVTMAGNDMRVAATVSADGRVSGVVSLPDGTSLGTFQSSIQSNRSLRITYSLAATAGSVILPPDVATSLVNAVAPVASQ